MAFQRGDVVLIPFPYTDLSASKTRPAVVVSSAIYHTARSELLLAYVSSQMSQANPVVDYVLADWKVSRVIVCHSEPERSGGEESRLGQTVWAL